MLSELFHPMTFKHKLASELKACLWNVFAMIQKHSRASQEYFVSLVDGETPLWFLHLFFLIENINLSKVTSFTVRLWWILFQNERTFHNPNALPQVAFASNLALSIVPLLSEVFVQNETPRDSRMWAWPCLWLQVM